MKYIKQLGNFKKCVSQHHSLEHEVREASGYIKTWSRWCSAIQFSSEGICIEKEFVQLILQL